MPIAVDSGVLFKEKVDVTAPRAMEFTPCAWQGGECEFRNMAVVRYSLGWDSLAPVYTVEENGVTCQAFGSGLGGDEYVHVATDLICAGTTAAGVEEIAPDSLPADTTAKQAVQACQRKCDVRADCTHFVTWANQACFTYVTCLATSDGAAVPTQEMVFVNTRRSPGKCDYIPVTSPWELCAFDDETCTRTEYSIVRFGAGVSFQYAVLQANATTGVGEIECSQSVFGIGSPGKRRCDAAYLGIPARIAGPSPSFVENVELWVKPKTSNDPVCQKCEGCIDADGKIILRNMAFGVTPVWTDGGTAGEACTEKTGVTCGHPADGDTVCPDELEHCVFTAGAGTQGSCALTAQSACTAALDVGTEGDECSMALKCSYTAAIPYAATVVGDVANTVDGTTANSGIVGGKTLDSVCSTASGSGALTWSVDLGSAQTVTSVRLWSTLSSQASTGVTVSVDGVSCGTVPALQPGSKADVECAVSGQVITVSSTAFLGLCEVEVLGTAPACPDFCVANETAYPAPIAATHQLVTHTAGLAVDPSCDLATTACDGEDETLMADIPGKSSVRLGGARYQGLFVAPVAGDYTFRSRFDDVGEVWLSKDADPRHTDLIIDSTSSDSGWFGPRHDPHQAHIKLEVGSRFQGPLYMTLLGSTGRTEEFLLVRGSAGWGAPAFGACTSGDMKVDYFAGNDNHDTAAMNSAPAVTRCEPMATRKGYIVDMWSPIDPDSDVAGTTYDMNLDTVAADLGITTTNFAVRYTTSVAFPVDGRYQITSKSSNLYSTTISGHMIDPSGWVDGDLQQGTVAQSFKAGVHEVVFDCAVNDAGTSTGRCELTWSLSAAGVFPDAIYASNPIVQEHVRDIVPMNQHGHPVELGAVRAIRMRNPDDVTCLTTATVTVRGRGYVFDFPGCFDGDAEVDVASATPVLDLAAVVEASVVGDARIPRDGLVSWHKWSGWSSAKQIWYDSSGNGHDAYPVSGSVLQTVSETGLHGAAGAVGCVAGDVKAQVSFGAIIQPQFTFCTVSRYTSDLGAKQGRILTHTDTAGVNWLHGHWNQNAGVAHYHHWKTANTGLTNTATGLSDDWVVLCGKNEVGMGAVMVQQTGGVTDITTDETREVYGSTDVGINTAGSEFSVRFSIDFHYFATVLRLSCDCLATDLRLICV